MTGLLAESPITPKEIPMASANTLTDAYRTLCRACGAAAVMNGWCMTHYTTDRRFSHT